MATLKGENLLNSIIESAGVEINELISNTLSARLQQMIDNGTYSKLAAGIAMSGFSTGINDATHINDLSDAIETNQGLIEDAAEGELGDIEFPAFGDGDNENVVDIDTGDFSTQTDFDADGEAYNFIDDAAVSNYAVIDNFSSDDTISFVNADVNDYAFSNGYEEEPEDVTLTYNNDGTVNRIDLIGVVSSDAIVHDLASFTDAVGFDAFG